MSLLSEPIEVERSTDDAGFSLVEAIVALAILALAATAFQVGLGIGSRAIRTVDMHRAAMAVARSELEMVGLGVPLEDGRRSGRTPDGFDWVVEQRARGQKSSRGRMTPYWVTVTVTWIDPVRSEPRTLSLASLKLKRGS